jgi:hypothetical protein
MSDNIVNLDDHRPHQATYVACLVCGHDWVAVAPSDTLHFQCPACQKMSGIAVEPYNPEFLKAYFKGIRNKKENMRRTMVVLNAKRLIEAALKGQGDE